MAAAAILNFIAHNSFTIAHVCTKFGMCITMEVLHEYMNAEILNKNKIQDGGGRHLGFLHKQR